MSETALPAKDDSLVDRLLEAGRNVRRYTLPDLDLDDEFFSNPNGKEPP